MASQALRIIQYKQESSDALFPGFGPEDRPKWVHASWRSGRPTLIFDPATHGDFLAGCNARVWIGNLDACIDKSFLSLAQVI